MKKIILHLGNNPLGRVILRMAKGYFRYDVGQMAAGLTYYMVFAIFPFLIFISSLLGFLNLPMISVEGEAANLLPADVVALINLMIAHMTETSSGAWLTFGLVFTVWFPLRAVKSLMSGISRIYEGEAAKLRTIRVFVLTLIIIVFVPVLLLLLVIGESVLGFVNNFIPVGYTFIDIWSRLRFVPVGVGLFCLISGVYFLSPYKMPKKRFVFPGALLSMAVWTGFSVIFAYYVDNIGNYSVIYGSISAIIAFLIWLNVSMIALLMGAVLNRALQEESKMIYNK